MNRDDALTADDVAALLQIGRNSVYRLAQTGELPSYRIGRKLRFTLRDVEGYIRKSTATQGASVLAQAAARNAAAADGSAHAPAERTAGDFAALPAGAGAGDSPSSAAADGPLRAAAGDSPHAFPSPVAALAASQPFSLRAPFVISGNDLSGDLLANYLNAAGVPTTRTYAGSYTGLVNLYWKQADAALVHLYDRKTNTYNIPYVQRLAPGVPGVVIRLLRRTQGLVVAQGNPKKLTTWGSLLHKGVRLANRERGCGTRVLLDEKLLSMEARPDLVEGYEREFASALTMATFVAQGGADVGVGTQRAAEHVPGLGFVPLQTEWLDLVVAKSPQNERAISLIKSLATDTRFRREFASLHGCDASDMGAITYDC